MSATPLASRSAFVTGANRGIGRAVALSLAVAGAAVTVTARRLAAASAVVEEIAAAGGRARADACDVADWRAMDAAVAAHAAAFGGIDVLVNNAAVIDPIAPIDAVDLDAWGAAIDVNVKGVQHGLRAALPRMGPGGVVVTISSGAATNPLEGWSAYCASKAAALMLTRCAHHEVGLRGVHVVGLSPGTVATDMQRVIKRSGVNPVSQLDWEAHIPADWVGRAVVWLCAGAAAEHAGGDVKLRDEAVRRAIGLIA